MPLDRKAADRGAVNFSAITGQLVQLLELDGAQNVVEDGIESNVVAQRHSKLFASSVSPDPLYWACFG